MARAREKTATEFRNNTAAADPPAGDPRRLISLMLALRGVLALFVGAMALLWPGVTLLALAFLFAAWALVDGIGTLVSGFSGREQGPRLAWILAGVLGVVA